MEVQVAETGPCSRSLQITIPSDKVQEHLEEMYKSASQQVQVKGLLFLWRCPALHLMLGLRQHLTKYRHLHQWPKFYVLSQNF